MARAVWKFVNANHESGFAYSTAVHGEFGPATASRVVVGDTVSRLAFKGDFVLDQGVVQSGTITGFDLYLNGVKIVKAKGYSFSYDDLVAAKEPNADFGLITALIAGKTTYRGSNDDNVISGNDQGGRLFGKGGDDLLLGGLGNDLLKGGKGNDTIRLNKGNDTAVGGKGNDTFLFLEEMSAVSVDKIKDFQPGKDTLQIAFSTFGDPITPGELLASEFRVGKHAKDEDDHIIFRKAKGAIYYDHDGVGGDAQILFAKVQKGLGLTHADFLIEGLEV